MNKIVKENLFKNIVILIVLAVLYLQIQNFLMSNLSNDKASASSIIVVASIIAVTACFGNFAFTYEKINPKKGFHRFLAHTTTGLLMLLIGISLIFTSVLTTIIMGNFIISDITFLLLYIASVFYDFWDLFRLDL